MCVCAVTPKKRVKPSGQGSLAHHLLLQGFDLRPPESRLARRGAAPARHR